MQRRKTNPWWKELGFSKKSELEEKIRLIVNNSPLCEPLCNEHTEFLLKILCHHHHYERKIAGMKHLEIRQNPSWNGPTLGIWVIRAESEEDISWVTALKPDGRPSVKEDVSNAARYEISPQIHDFHECGECSVCELCGKDMVRGYKLHVDHVKPFEQLFSEFLSVEEITYSDIETEDVGGVESRFTDRQLASKWITFHRDHASLRLTHKLCNLKR